MFNRKPTRYHIQNGYLYYLIKDIFQIKQGLQRRKRVQKTKISATLAVLDPDFRKSPDLDALHDTLI